MSKFNDKLNKVLSEMAQLAGWEGTSTTTYDIIYDGEAIESINGSNPKNAIDNFIKAYSENGLLETNAEENGVSVEEYTAKLKAKIGSSEDGALHFSTKDLRLINLKKTKKTIEQWLNNNPTPYEYRIVFDSENMDDIDETPGIITFVKTGNAGGDPLTPHMILHTLGHALVKFDTKSISTKLLPIVSKITKIQITNEEDLTQPICKLLHMKAAEFTILEQPRGFPTFEEMINEMMAIYVKNGRVKISPNKHCDFQISTQECLKIQQIIHEYCELKLKQAVGQTIYDD